MTAQTKEELVLSNGNIVVNKGFVVKHKDDGRCWGIIKKDCQSVTMGWAMGTNINPLPASLLTKPTDLANGDPDYHTELSENGVVVPVTITTSVCVDEPYKPVITPFMWDTDTQSLPLGLGSTMTHSMVDGKHRLHDYKGDVIIELNDENILPAVEGLMAIQTFMEHETQYTPST